MAKNAIVEQKFNLAKQTTFVVNISIFWRKCCFLIKILVNNQKFDLAKIAIFC